MKVTKKQTQRPPSPLKDATFFTQILFGWAWPLLKLGSSRPLEEIDLPDVHLLDSSAYNKSYMDQLWKQRNEGKHSLARVFFKDYLKTTMLPQIILVINSASRIGQAVALGFLLEQFAEGNSADDTNIKQGYLWSGIMVICGLVAFPTKQRLYFEMYRKGLQIRIAIVAKLYEKTLQLYSTGSCDSISTGKLTNLASNDVERFLLASIPSLYLIVGPLEAVVILYVGIQIIGPVFAVGLILFVFLVPVQFFLGKRFTKFRSEVAAFTDARVNLVSQAVTGARIMKMNGWELEFEKRISALREKEIEKLRRASRYKAVNDAIYYFSSAVVSVFIFSAHVLFMGGTLNPRNVYTTLSLLNILHLSLTKQIPNAVMSLSECYVSCNRIEEFLDLPDNVLASSTDFCSNESNLCDDTMSLIALSNVSCFWNSNKSLEEKESSNRHSAVAISDVSLSFEAGELSCISGKVGCGKSALILSLAGELNSFSGSIKRNYSSLGYAAQNAWIMNGSIKENITMGLSFNKEWYEQVVDACGLRLDFCQLSNGDLTIVGDRGVQCSGGQRARIGLARAFYKDPQVLLLDDPLSAVDGTVARSIYKLAIQDLGVKRGKCVILSTHQVQFIDKVDQSIVMRGGKIISCERINGSECDLRSQSCEAQYKTLQGRKAPSNGLKISENSISLVSDSVHMESRNTGVVQWPTWAAYGRAAGGSAACLLLFFVFTTTQSALLLTIVQVGTWASAQKDSQDDAVWFGTIFGIVSILICLSIARAQMSFHMLIGASSELHNKMLSSVLRSKIDFFDTNPLGLILNRFSADVGINDETLPLTIYDFLVGAFIVFGGVITASTVLPFIWLALPPLLWSFLRLRLIFVSTTRELKRLEGMSRSPIFAMMSESLQGITTIRANNCSRFFKRRFEEIHDQHTRAYFSFVASSRWFATRMDILSFTLMSIASATAVLFHDQGWFEVNPAILGLALTLLLQIAGTNFPWIVRQSAEIVNQMVSTERILEFGDLLPEAPLAADFDKSLEMSWPANGEICINGIDIRYRPELPLALDQLSFSIPPGSRVGVVGRTGSGKSTLCQALFRLLEAEEGSVSIDGVDISKVGLHRLRTRISVIPQTPTLFSGCSVRENLDFLGVHNDDSIEKALEDVEMSQILSELESMVSEGGSNFSVGQRQLLCLARANLNKNKILILDECTANVDIETDQLLHKALNRNYKEATIIAIAHRLNTVINYDYILVMGSGRVLEFGSPSSLLDTSGVFSQMVADSGFDIAKGLHKQALSEEIHNC